MSCWRVLELSEQPDGERIPQLLVKPVFGPDSYTVHLTCLSNIWSEELDVDGIVDRASQEQSPIEVSKQDNAQLAILLDNVKKSLENSNDAVCRITRNDTDGVTLHTTISLPKPLDSLTWKFYLGKRTSTILKNELILPLLISSHIQHERLTGLVSAINDKDKAITRLVDHYESSNLDLAAAFPIISGLKSGRKGIKREQAAKHIPALQPFREEAFKQRTGQLVDSDVSTLGLFQEALAECSPSVPSKLKADDGDLDWWTSVPARLSPPKAPTKGKAKAAGKSATVAEPASKSADPSDDETEDEFETHENFKNRALPERLVDSHERPREPVTKPSPSDDDDDSTEDDDDLDAPPKSHSQRSSQSTRKPPPRAKSSTPEDVPLPKPDHRPVAQPKVKGFRIGGKIRKSFDESPPPVSEGLDTTTEGHDVVMQEPPPSQFNGRAEVSPKKAKRNFKIGGKGKEQAGGSTQTSEPAPPMTDRTRATHSPSIHPRSSPVSRLAKEETPAEEEKHEETPEEKAERRRAELKRKTEEAAKKQAQSKKKRRF